MKRCYHCMNQIEKENTHTCPQCGRSLSARPVSTKYLQPGTVLQGKFMVGYPLGAGGFGNTYIGWNQVLCCKVAVKEFYPESYCHRAYDQATVAVSDERAQKRFEIGRREFLEEARSVAALQDIPGVVRIASFFEENETGYIVMEYLEGMDVKAILGKSGGKKDYEWCRRVTLTVLHTLREIHRRGVLHRDIAPDNVFVTSEGIIKLIDFGAARQISVLSSARPDIVLKAGYAPIEQYSREAAQGPYTDLYAVAAMFYRMLTGQKPIPANERLEQDALIPPSEMGIQIPQQAEMGMMVCLNVQPQYRLQSADEFMEALSGKDFTPVYEPEWILPPMEEKPGIKGRIARIPVAAWAGLCLGCICLVGLGIFAASRYRDRAAEEALVNGAVVMSDLTGMTEEEAAARIEAMERAAQKAGITLDLELENEGYIFDLDEEKDGTIAAQTLEPSSIIYDPNAESQEELEGVKRDKDGNITGTVVCSLYSDTKLHYSDISGMNAYAMAQKLGIDPGDTKRFVGTDEAPDSSYYDLVRLVTPDGEITAKELGKKKHRQKEIAYDKEKMRIVYSNIPFFYWEALPDFKQEYVTLDAVPAQETYIWKNETDRKKSGRQRSLKDVGGMIDDSYCSIAASKGKDGCNVGDIVGQAFPAGEELDTSRTKPEGGLLYVIGDEVLYSGKTGEQLKKELADHFGESVDVTAGGSGLMGQPVLSVTVKDAEGKTIDHFRKGDHVSVTLDLKATPVPTPVPEPQPAAPNNNGGYVAPAPAAPAPAAPAPQYIEPEEPEYIDPGYIDSGNDDPGGGGSGNDDPGGGDPGGGGSGYDNSGVSNLIGDIGEAF